MHFCQFYIAHTRKTVSWKYGSTQKLAKEPSCTLRSLQRPLRSLRENERKPWCIGSGGGSRRFPRGGMVIPTNVIAKSTDVGKFRKLSTGRIPNEFMLSLVYYLFWPIMFYSTMLHIVTSLMVNKLLPNNVPNIKLGDTLTFQPIKTCFMILIM